MKKFTTLQNQKIQNNPQWLKKMEKNWNYEKKNNTKIYQTVINFNNEIYNNEQIKNNENFELSQEQLSKIDENNDC